MGGLCKELIIILELYFKAVFVRGSIEISSSGPSLGGSRDYSVRLRKNNGQGEHLPGD